MTRFVHTFASALLLGLMALPVFAQTGDEGPFRLAPDETEIRASDFIGRAIYATEAETTDENAGVGTDWDNIGEVSDVILTRDGQVAAVLVDVGGFLGIGERTVAIDMNAIRLVSDAGTSEDLNDYFIVLQASRANLETAPEYTSQEEAVVGEGDAAENATTEAEEAAVDTAAGGTVTAEDFEREGFVRAEPEAVTVDTLAGASVYDQTDERIGEIVELMLDDNGNVQSIIFEAGEYLGLGQRTVSIDIQNLVFLRSEAGEEIRVFTGLTRGQIESLPAHDL
jgi:sporulation protein YlmC with PRC-barrel domain